MNKKILTILTGTMLTASVSFAAPDRFAAG